MLKQQCAQRHNRRPAGQRILANIDHAAGPQTGPVETYDGFADFGADPGPYAVQGNKVELRPIDV